ncbi:Clathrin heavy chain [Pyrenophora tritici-repentis]|nr:Clathrin heavy chain [Pyrenophora tritici-repentis]KAI1674691.1 Clathrin heavy chain [Pyrenophora tritici-repentis]PWO25050.1 SSL2, DNA or RNA helicase of superfamily II [Pyrenophora tritici-repentis]
MASRELYSSKISEAENNQTFQLEARRRITSRRDAGTCSLAPPQHRTRSYNGKSTLVFGQSTGGPCGRRKLLHEAPVRIVNRGSFKRRNESHANYNLRQHWSWLDPSLRRVISTSSRSGRRRATPTAPRSAVIRRIIDYVVCRELYEPFLFGTCISDRESSMT